MEPKLKIAVDVRRIEFDRSSIFGPIYIDFGYAKFPDENWDDFLFVLTDWMHHLSRFAMKTRKTVTLKFADGQAWVKLTKTKTDFIDIACTHIYGHAAIDKTKKGRERAYWPFMARTQYRIKRTFTAADVQRAIVRAARSILRHAAKRRINHDDVEWMKRLLKEVA